MWKQLHILSHKKQEHTYINLQRLTQSFHKITQTYIHLHTLTNKITYTYTHIHTLTCTPRNLYSLTHTSGDIHTLNKITHKIFRKKTFLHLQTINTIYNFLYTFTEILGKIKEKKNTLTYTLTYTKTYLHAFN